MEIPLFVFNVTDLVRELFELFKRFLLELPIAFTGEKKEKRRVIAFLVAIAIPFILLNS